MFILVFVMAMHQNTTKMWHRIQVGNSYKICWFVDLVTKALGWQHKALPFRERHPVRQAIPDLCQTVRRHDVCLLGSCISCHSSCPTSLAWLPESAAVMEGRHRPAVPLSISPEDPLVLLAVALTAMWARRAKCSSRAHIPRNIPLQR